jgi:proprotein convertase subtilisin/kexin type 5
MGIGEALITIKACEEANCLRCASAKNCLSCKASTFLSLQTCVAECPLGFFSHTVDRICYVQCPKGFYGDLSTNACTTCPAACTACSSVNSCSACATNNFLLGTACVTNCRTGQGGSTKLYGDATTSTCKSCVTPCDTCSPTNGQSCNSCVIGYLTTTNTCVIECPAGSFGSLSAAVGGPVNPVCNPCNASCANCVISATTCTSCSGSNSLSSGTCVATCPAGTYPSTNVCVVCSPPCLTCSAVATCTSCLQGYLSAGTCLNSCPGEMFLNGQVCSACQNNCKTCSSSTACLSCDAGRFLSASACVKACLSNQFFKNTATNTCSPCTLPCATCSETNGATCTSCVVGFLLNSACVTSCPVGQYGAASVCTACPANCLICQPSNNNALCTKCNGEASRYLSNGACVADCPAKQYSYLDTITKEGLCLACSVNCDNCVEAPFRCLTCPASLQYLYEKRCYAAAPEGFFLNNGVITQCLATCATCTTTASTCASCPLSQFLSGTTCVTTCPANFIGKDGVCLACSTHVTGCQTCQLGACNTCQTGLNLYQGTCLSVCPPGTLALAQICQPCQNCLTCSMVATNCTACPNDKILSKNACIATCPPGQYSQLSTGTCQPCSPSCATCDQFKANKCLTCPANSTATPNYLL